MDNPNDLLNLWLQEEKQAGAPNPRHAVLSTSATQGIAHGRVVAIRDISEEGILFFTQKGTRKVIELSENPEAAMTFWLELFQREVIVEGVIEALTQNENEHYWQAYPREAQIRFSSYAPTSAQRIDSKQELEMKKQTIEMQYAGKSLPYHPLYLGFRLRPQRIVFYAFRTDALSDVYEFQFSNNKWYCQLLSP